MADKRTPAAWEVGIYLRRGPVFFEAFGCGASHSNYNLTLKPNAGIHAARIPGARREEARGRCAREGGVSYAFYRFDGLRSFRNACGRGAQRHFARDDNRSPATAGQSGGGANAFSSMPNRKTHTPAKTMPASCPPGKCPANNTRRVRLSVISFNIGCSFPAASLGTPCDAPSESLKKTGVSPKRPFFPSNLAMQNRAAPGFPRPQKGGPWESPLPTRTEGS